MPGDGSVIPAITKFLSYHSSELIFGKLRLMLNPIFKYIMDISQTGIPCNC